MKGEVFRMFTCSACWSSGGMLASSVWARSGSTSSAKRPAEEVPRPWSDSFSSIHFDST